MPVINKTKNINSKLYIPQNIGKRNQFIREYLRKMLKHAKQNLISKKTSSLEHYLYGIYFGFTTGLILSGHIANSYVIHSKGQIEVKWIINGKTFTEIIKY